MFVFLFFMFCFLFCVFCIFVMLCIVSSRVYSCLFYICVQYYRLLPPGGNLIAVNVYRIISS